MGAGCLGGYYGGLLARAGEDVTLIARGVHLEAIGANGLTIERPGSGGFNIPVQATSDPAGEGYMDFILFCVKAYDTEPAVELIRPIVGPDTLVATIQNGVDSRERIERILGVGHVIPCVTFLQSVIHDPGVIHVRNNGILSIGEGKDPLNHDLQQVLGVLEGAGIDVELHSDIQRHLWEKVVALCGIGCVEVLTRLPVGPMMACPETREMNRRALQEGVAVARAAGILIADDFVKRIMDFVANEIPPTHRPSMYFDLIAGRRIEIEALNGEMVRRGRRYGVATPTHFVIYAGLKPYLDGAPEIS